MFRDTSYLSGYELSKLITGTDFVFHIKKSYKAICAHILEEKSSKVLIYFLKYKMLNCECQIMQVAYCVEK